MKKIIKITVVAVVILTCMALVGCAAIESLLFGGDPYAFSDIVMTQIGINEFQIEFTANCGRDDVEVYLTEGFRLSENATPLEVSKSVEGRKARFSFSKKLNLGEDYYIWLIYGNKEAKISITAPSMFPSITKNEDGSATFNFNYTYGTAWGSFCDPNGKAVYKSSSPVFDSSAVLIQEGIEITEEYCQIPADMMDNDCYYYSVSTAKEGMLTIISRPVMIYDDLKSQIEGISANITNDLLLKVDVEIADQGDVADKLQLVVKTDSADEIYIIDCVYENGVATMTMDLTQLYFEGLWYDVLFAWDGAIVMDVPKYFGGHQVDASSTVKKDGIIYSITGWKDESAPAMSEILKVYFEEDTTKYADEICSSYLVTFSATPAPTLQVIAKFKGSASTVPVLAITSGDKTKIKYVEGVLNDDGTYTYSLEVSDALTKQDTWYDLRFFIGNDAYEMLKDSCITYTDFAGKYINEQEARLYEFREYNGMLKLMYTDIVEE